MLRRIAPFTESTFGDQFGDAIKEHFYFQHSTTVLIERCRGRFDLLHFLEVRVSALGPCEDRPRRLLAHAVFLGDAVLDRFESWMLLSQEEIDLVLRLARLLSSEIARRAAVMGRLAQLRGAARDGDPKRPQAARGRRSAEAVLAAE